MPSQGHGTCRDAALKFKGVMPEGAANSCRPPRGYRGHLTRGEIKYDKRDPDITEGKSDPVKFDYSAFHE